MYCLAQENFRISYNEEENNNTGFSVEWKWNDILKQSVRI